VRTRRAAHAGHPFPWRNSTWRIRTQAGCRWSTTTSPSTPTCPEL